MSDPLIVEVWQVGLDQPSDVVRCLDTFLDPKERERAARLKRPGAAARWTVARGALRLLLGTRLCVLPEEIEFEHGPHGKPELSGTVTCFNLTHSGALALIALAEDCDVGIDVERPGRNAAAVERTLSEGERASGDDLLQIWCRKEALAKAIGGGLQWAPQDFDTSRRNGYALTDIPLADGYVGALAAAGPSAAFTLHRLALGSTPAADAGRS
jgi:4'-phosphopantetheinyl transferase